jgi:hypothetical protein
MPPFDEAAADEDADDDTVATVVDPPAPAPDDDAALDDDDDDVVLALVVEPAPLPVVPPTSLSTTVVPQATNVPATPATNARVTGTGMRVKLMMGATSAAYVLMAGTERQSAAALLERRARPGRG